MLTFKWCNSIQVHPRWHSVQPSVHVRRERNGNQLFACYNNGEAQGLVLLKKVGARNDRKDVSGFRRWETWVVGSKWFSSTSVISQEQLTMLEHVLKTHRPSVIGQPHLPPKLFSDFCAQKSIVSTILQLIVWWPWEVRSLGQGPPSPLYPSSPRDALKMGIPRSWRNGCEALFQMPFDQRWGFQEQITSSTTTIYIPYRVPYTSMYAFVCRI